MNEELLYNQMYEKTAECGRTQFIRLLMDKERENQQLKDNWNKLKEIIKKKFVAQGGFTSYEWNDLLNEILDKMQEIEQGSDSDE